MFSVRRPSLPSVHAGIGLVRGMRDQQETPALPGSQAGSDGATGIPLAVVVHFRWSSSALPSGLFPRSRMAQENSVAEAYCPR